MVVTEKLWYVVHTYSGYENKVKHNLEKRVQTMDMQDKIFTVLVPMVEETEHKNGKRNSVMRKVFPGYVLVEMMLTDDSWYVVRNTPGVTGFVGSSGPGSKPTPLMPDEVSSILRSMGSDEPRVVVNFSLGENIKVNDGPFTDFIGRIDEIDADRSRLKVYVNMFGRDTPVELDFVQVDKL